MSCKRRRQVCLGWRQPAAGAEKLRTRAQRAKHFALHTRAVHCTKVPFKSVLMHVCVLDASDGVVDGDNEVRPARNSAQLVAIV